MRFKTNTNGLADLLPGLLYPHLKSRFDAVESLPSGEIPKTIREQMPNAPYQATKRIIGKGANLNIAEHAFVVEVKKPYWGWRKFSSLIFEVISAVNKTDLVSDVERSSLRYQNVISTKDDPNDLSGLKLEINVADHQISGHGFQLRAEIEHNNEECMSVIQVKGDATASYLIDGKKSISKGLLLDIDTMKFTQLSNFWKDYEGIVDSIHKAEKEAFFSLLKPETIELMEPIWK